MIVLDILKQFKDETRLELDIYDISSYKNMINKITLIKEIIKKFKHRDSLFKFENCFYITNITEPVDGVKPYIISVLDYDTLGVEIDYNLLVMLKIDLSIYSKELELLNIKKVKAKDRHINLSELNLYKLIDDINTSLSSKITDIHYNDTVVIDAYDDICKLYDKTNDKVLKKIKRSKTKAKYIKIATDFIELQHLNYKIAVTFTYESILNMIKKTINTIVEIYKGIINVINKFKVNIKRKYTKLKILSIFTIKGVLGVKDEYTKEEKGK